VKINWQKLSNAVLVMTSAALLFSCEWNYQDSSLKNLRILRTADLSLQNTDTAYKRTQHLIQNGFDSISWAKQSQKWKSDPIFALAQQKQLLKLLEREDSIASHKNQVKAEK
jgi:hypothetical protein